MAKRSTRRTKADSATVTHTRHKTAKRKNNPPATLAGEAIVPKVPKATYSYSPRMSPALRFDPEGEYAAILRKASKHSLTPEEIERLEAALAARTPWLEWADKQEKDARGLSVDPVALHIHERLSAQAILNVARRKDIEPTLFASPEMTHSEQIQFYKHDIDWTNRLILGDSLAVMSSLARRESLAGQVQMIYFDPPYGIKFGSNFQPQVGQRDVKDNDTDLTREPEMVKAYRDTWHLGIHSYLSYLRDRLIAARELLTDTGSIFVQISDENLHRVRQVMDEVFGPDNFFANINYRTMTPLGASGMASVFDYVLWYARNKPTMKFRAIYRQTDISEDGEYVYVDAPGGQHQKLTEMEKRAIADQKSIFKRSDLASSGYTPTCVYDFEFLGEARQPKGKSWRTNTEGMNRLIRAERLFALGDRPYFRQYLGDFGQQTLENSWTDTAAGFRNYLKTAS